LIMIVLEAALELELKREKYFAIGKAFFIALIGLVASTYVAALILHQFIEGMDMASAWLYATPLSILSSAIIIPSVTGLKEHKKEFHIYESTFSDILGIMLFYFLTGNMEVDDHGGGVVSFFGTTVLTIVLSLIVSYLIVLIFQKIRTHTKLFLLIAVLLLLYAVGKQMHLSSLIIILIFGLLIANMRLFFQGPLRKLLDYKKARHIYDGLHVVTAETAFVVRTFFFVIFGLTITLSSLLDFNVAMVSILILLSIYAIRFVFLRIFVGKDILPQLFIAPRGLITVLLFYAIPESLHVEGFNAGILLFIIIGTSLIMTVAMIYDKNKTTRAIQKAKEIEIGYEKWKAPSITDEKE
ncbi:MAG: cation:proton antiporter, partial [Saprospiraceae bacterium]